MLPLLASANCWMANAWLLLCYLVVAAVEAEAEVEVAVVVVVAMMALAASVGAQVVQTQGLQTVAPRFSPAQVALRSCMKGCPDYQGPV